MSDLEALYAKVPRLECKGKCQECCGPIAMGPAEAERTGHPNDFAWDCPLLSPLGTCTVYDRRPMICRLWGVVKTMPCPYGCVPERWLTHEEGGTLLVAATAVGA